MTEEEQIDIINKKINQYQHELVLRGLRHYSWGWAYYSYKFYEEELRRFCRENNYVFPKQKWGYEKDFYNNLRVFLLRIYFKIKRVRDLWVGNI